MNELPPILRFVATHKNGYQEYDSGYLPASAAIHKARQYSAEGWEVIYV